MVELKIRLYSFEELKPAAQEKAIFEHRRFLLDELRPDFIDGITDWDDPEKMKMYHEEYEYLEENANPIIENIKNNEYLFFASGEMCWSCQYTAGPKKGRTEINVHGEIFTIAQTPDKTFILTEER